MPHFLHWFYFFCKETTKLIKCILIEFCVIWLYEMHLNFQIVKYTTMAPVVEKKTSDCLAYYSVLEALVCSKPIHPNYALIRK